SGYKQSLKLSRLILSRYVLLVVSNWSVYLVGVFFKVAHNVFGLCVRAGFEAQSFNLLLRFIRSTKLQVCTSARLTQNPCYQWFSFLFYSSHSVGFLKSI